MAEGKDKSASDEKAGWDYKPDEGLSTSAPQKSVTAISWTASEYIEHEHNAGWYALLVLTTAALAGAVYLATRDYFACGITVSLGLILGVSSSRKPRQVTYELDSSGLKIGKRTYGYGLFKSYSLMHENAVLSSIDLMPLKRFMPPVSAYFDPADEKKIIANIGERLPYQEKKLDSIDRLSRFLRL